MLEKKYKDKVKAMQVYVPLLTKLITKLESKNDKSEENLEKISQLKILLQQLLDPKPGISFEELNDCHQVMENLFKLNRNETSVAKPQTDPLNDNEKKSNDTAEIHLNPKQHTEKPSNRENNSSQKIATSSAHNSNTKIDKERLPTSVEKEIETPKPQKFIKDKTYISANEENEKKNINSPQEINTVAGNQQNAETYSLNEIKNKNLIEDFNDAPQKCFNKDNQKEIEQSEIKQIAEINELATNKSENSLIADEPENVEIIEFSEEESNESFEEEMILPDDEELFLDQNIKLNNEQSDNKDNKNEETDESENDSDKEIIEHINKTILLKTSVIKSKEKVIETLKNDVNEIKENPKADALDNVNIVKENVTKVKQFPTTNNQPAVELHKDKDKVNDKKQDTLKRVSDQKVNDCENSPVKKKVKKIQTIITTNTTNTIKLVTDTNDNTLDVVQKKKEVTNYENEQLNEDIDDDIEIIENRSSPILIDSDDDDVIESNTKQDEKVTEIVQPIQQPQQKIIISNVESLNNKKVIMKKNPTKLTAQESVWVSQTQVQTKQQQTAENNIKQRKQSKSLKNSDGLSTFSNIKLKRKQIFGPNPQLFCTKVGDRKLYIPNAFYGNIKTENNNLDAAHCRWLENFLRHFCSPYNIAHNTCFLLLQRALREEDFQRVKAERSAMSVEKVGEIDLKLLRSLYTIFYINGEPKSQKLTFVGRKFCNLAFVNILDKTISLTVDSRTNAVTSRTRISAATLETVRNEKTTTTLKKTSTELTENVATSSVVSSNTEAMPRSSVINSNEKSNNLNQFTKFIQIQQKPTKEKTIKPPNDLGSNLQRIPATIIHMKKSIVPSKSNKIFDENSSAVAVVIEDDELPQCSLPDNTYESFVSCENDIKADNDEEFITGDNNTINNSMLYHNHQDNSNCEQVDLSAAISKDIISPTISKAKKKTIPEKPSKSFEMAFLERLAHQKEDFRIQKVKKTSELILPQNELIVLDDDDEDEPVKLPLEPRLIEEKKVKPRIKNIDASIHGLSEYKNVCLVCNRKALHVVGHYVNKHPDYEVFVSRPTPKFANLLLTNEMSIASHDPERNNLNLFISTCVFCEKKAAFSFSYWYQHFASHTGEFAYKCNACGIRKPTRALLLSHLENCHQQGSLDVIIHYDYSCTKITAYMCRICNFTQMSCASLLRHLKNEHNISRVEKKDWMNVTLLELPKMYDNDKTSEECLKIDAKTNELNVNKNLSINLENRTPIIIRDSYGDIFEIAEIDDGKTVAVDLTANSEPRVVNEAELETSNSPKWYNTQMDQIGDVEGIIQAYINKKN